MAGQGRTCGLSVLQHSSTPTLRSTSSNAWNFPPAVCPRLGTYAAPLVESRLVGPHLDAVTLSRWRLVAGLSRPTGESTRRSRPRAPTKCTEDKGRLSQSPRSSGCAAPAVLAERLPGTAGATCPLGFHNAQGGVWSAARTVGTVAVVALPFAPASPRPATAGDFRCVLCGSPSEPNKGDCKERREPQHIQVPSGLRHWRFIIRQSDGRATNGAGWRSEAGVERLVPSRFRARDDRA